jgi:hypothetical protein
MNVRRARAKAAPINREEAAYLSSNRLCRSRKWRQIFKGSRERLYCIMRNTLSEWRTSSINTGRSVTLQRYPPRYSSVNESKRERSGPSVGANRKLELLWVESARMAHEAGALRGRDLKRLVVDTSRSQHLSEPCQAAHNFRRISPGLELSYPLLILLGPTSPARPRRSGFLTGDFAWYLNRSNDGSTIRLHAWRREPLR